MAIFKVRCYVVKQWLEFLKANHIGYQDIIIDEAALNH